MTAAKEAGKDPAGEHRVEGQIGGEPGQQHKGDRQRDAAKLGHAYVDPPQARQKESHSVAKTAPGSLFRRGFVQQSVEAKQGGDHQRPVAEGGEGQHCDGTRGQCTEA